MGYSRGVRDFRKLIAWQRAHEITLNVYRLTHAFPADERFRLVEQLRRASVSVPSNIAEGAGHSSSKEFKRFLSIAAASASEMQYQLLLAYDLGYIRPEDRSVIDDSHEVKRLIWGLSRSTR